jgi:hypothetical protein
VYDKRKKVMRKIIPVAISFFIGYDESVVVFFDDFFSRFATSKFYKNRSFIQYQPTQCAARKQNCFAITFIYLLRIEEIPIPERMHITGAKTSIRRTMTP